jgi:hypothetical protein
MSRSCALRATCAYAVVWVAAAVDSRIGEVWLDRTLLPQDCPEKCDEHQPLRCSDFQFCAQDSFIRAIVSLVGRPLLETSGMATDIVVELKLAAEKRRASVNGR